MMSLRLDTRAFNNSLSKIKKVQKAISNASPFFSEISKKMKENVDTNFDKEGSYLGTKWSPLKQSTIEGRLRSGFGSGPILQRTGKLKRSTYEKERTNTRAVVSNSASYYPYHQLGTRKMPVRTIINWNAKTKKEAQRSFNEYNNKILKTG